MLSLSAEAKHYLSIQNKCSTRVLFPQNTAIDARPVRYILTNCLAAHLAVKLNGTLRRAAAAVRFFFTDIIAPRQRSGAPGRLLKKRFLIFRNNKVVKFFF